MNKSLSSKYRVAHAYMFLFSLRFTEVYWVVYLREKGLSFAMVGLLETVFHVVSFSAEIPTGIIADRFGRRISLAVGRAMAGLSAAVTLLAKDWRLLIISFGISAISYTCHSGAFDALIYDSLPEERRCDFAQILGKLNSTYLFGTAVAGGVAALVATVSLDWLYRLVVVTDIIAALVCLRLPELRTKTARVDNRGEATPTSDSTPLVGEDVHGCEVESKSDVKTLIASLRNRDLRNILLLWGISGALATSVVFYGQSLLKEALLPISIIGLAGTAANLLAMVPASSAYKLQRRFGQLRPVVRGSYALPALTIALAAASSASGWPALAVVALLYISVPVVNETMYPLFSDAANARIGSLNRAAVLSSGGMLFSIFMMVTFPLIGYFGDTYGLRWGLVAGALLIATCMTPVALSLARTKSQD